MNECIGQQQNKKDEGQNNSVGDHCLYDDGDEKSACGWVVASSLIFVEWTIGEYLVARVHNLIEVAFDVCICSVSVNEPDSI